MFHICRFLRAWLVLALLALVGAGAAHAAEGRRADLWDIEIGKPLAEIPRGYVELACGTNGGPPSLPLGGFGDFLLCPPEADGLREVYFRYDNRREYEARALDMPIESARYGGTMLYDIPVVLSVLVGDDGTVLGKRAVTDPRNLADRPRFEFWSLGNLLRHRLGDDGWVCSELDPAPRDGPVGPVFVKTDCSKKLDGVSYLLEQRYLQKPGQSFLDPHTRRIASDAFESSTRFEMRATDGEED